MAKEACKYVRMSPEMLSRVEKFREKMQKKSPGSSVSLSDALRTLIYAGLDHART